MYYQDKEVSVEISFVLYVSCMQSDIKARNEGREVWGLDALSLPQKYDTLYCTALYCTGLYRTVLKCSVVRSTALTANNMSFNHQCAE